MRGRSSTVNTRESADTCGIDAAVRGLSFTGLARKSYCSGDSMMCGIMVFEYRSLT